MKKLALFLVISIGLATIPYAAWFLSDDYEPIQISTNNSNVSATTYRLYTIAKPSSARAKYCFTDIKFSASGFISPMVFSVLDGGLPTPTTAYMIDITTTPVQFSWPREDALCLTPGATAHFQINGTSAVWKLNGKGFLKP